MCVLVDFVKKKEMNKNNTICFMLILFLLMHDQNEDVEFFIHCGNHQLLFFLFSAKTHTVSIKDTIDAHVELHASTVKYVTLRHKTNEICYAYVDKIENKNSNNNIATIIWLMTFVPLNK